jgi:HEAT repeat protein
MALSDRPSIDSALAQLFRVERTGYELRSELATAPTPLVLEAIAAAIPAAKGRPDEPSRVLELTALASILGQLSGASVVDSLIDILASEEPEARHAAGSVLEELAFERFKEVALGIERALARLPAENLALRELPYLLVEVPEPGVAKLLTLFLKHKDPAAVAAAIEACVELGDPGAARLIAPLESDPRTVELDDEEDDEGEGGTVTIGELAKEARHLLESHGDDTEHPHDHDHDHDHPHGGKR